ncbi:MAG TPA: HoxN/HupN/NixA family nickel/cobalt transporter [Dactylosporangium sp.]|nr:HoxN/HupN/NixA family nickel/cobalt transporter [Dactylosporangium sp.]
MSARARTVLLVCAAAAIIATGSALILAAHASGNAQGVLGIGTALLALTLGARHAFDADHIAAIDNTTRRLLASGRRAGTVGFAFALGHSTVVVLLALLVGSGMRAITGALGDPSSGLREAAGVIGGVASSAYLLIIAALNARTLRGLSRSLTAARSGAPADAVEPAHRHGLADTLLRPVWRLIDAPWKMFPVGFVFGLGFDTASEIGLLVLTARQNESAVPLWALLGLPLLFAGGMCLVDVIDSAVICAAYGWSGTSPARRLRYDVTVTTVSIAAATGVAAVQVAGLLGSLGGPAAPLARLDTIDSGVLGLVITAALLGVLAWAMAGARRRRRTA